MLLTETGYCSRLYGTYNLYSKSPNNCGKYQPVSILQDVYNLYAKCTKKCANIYCKVASSSLSWLVAHFQIFRRLTKGKFDAYVLWPLAKKFQNWIVDRSTARNFTVACILSFCQNIRPNWHVRHACKSHMLFCQASLRVLRLVALPSKKKVTRTR